MFNISIAIAGIFFHQQAIFGGIFRGLLAASIIYAVEKRRPNYFLPFLIIDV
jgi:hypothetical protein